VTFQSVSLLTVDRFGSGQIIQVSTNNPNMFKKRDVTSIVISDKSSPHQQMCSASR
jgi:hypothetical protein